MERKIHVIVGNPISDIGKGRLAACIATSLSFSKVVKIDPLLNRLDPILADLTKGNNKTSDAKTYQKMGLDFTSNQMLIQGNVLYDFLSRLESGEVDPNSAPRLRFTDFSYYFAEKIFNLFDSETKNLVIEVGGSITDPEVICIPKALKIAAKSLNCKLEFTLLSYFDYTEDNQIDDPVKTRHVTYSLEQMSKVYGEVDKIFVRGRSLEVQVRRNMDSIMRKISREVCLDNNQLIYLPNFTDIFEQKSFIENVLN